MGSICPVPWVDAALMRTIRDRVVEPTYEALRRDGLCYTGVLYFGLMITADGPKVLEFNVRFGDPETQVLLPMLNADLGGILEAMVSRSLSRLPAPPASGGSALGVVVASRGYPDASEPNAVVTAVPAAREGASVVFHASTVLGDDGKVRTGGGRCFTAVGLGTDLAQAAERAYGAAGGVRFDGAWYRADIGRKFMA